MQACISRQSRLHMVGWPVPSGVCSSGLCENQRTQTVPASAGTAVAWAALLNVVKHRAVTDKPRREGATVPNRAMTA